MTTDVQIRKPLGGTLSAIRSDPRTALAGIVALAVAVAPFLVTALGSRPRLHGRRPGVARCAVGSAAVGRRRVAPMGRRVPARLGVRALHRVQRGHLAGRADDICAVARTTTPPDTADDERTRAGDDDPARRSPGGGGDRRTAGTGAVRGCRSRAPHPRDRLVCEALGRGVRTELPTRPGGRCRRAPTQCADQHADRALLPAFAAPAIRPAVQYGARSLENVCTALPDHRRSPRPRGTPRAATGTRTVIGPYLLTLER